jgi:hypothetical protein
MIVETIETVMSGTMDGNWQRGGRPSQEWIDDIRDWCKQDLQGFKIAAQVMNNAVDTYGPSTHGC